MVLNTKEQGWLKMEKIDTDYKRRNKKNFFLTFQTV